MCRLIILIVCFMISSCSNLAKVTYKAEIENDYSESGLSRLVASIQRKSNVVDTQYKINRYTPLTLSPGDRLIVNIANGKLFNGVYEINIDGMLTLPYISQISVVGKTVNQVEYELRERLISERIFRRENILVSCRIQQWSAVRVMVSGSVFSPGGVVINNRSVEQKNYLQTQKNGDSPFERFLTTAIRSAGGVRPDADLKKIKVIRNGRLSEFDISGIIYGSQFEDIPLVAGDQVIVPSIGMAQQELMRPSQITPPGFDIFISNLSTPADSNAKSAIGKHARSIPFGTRLLRGLISANCVGGTISTNASRMAILVSTDIVTGQTKVTQRSIEELVRNHNRDEFNPYLMPNDGIACYDSNVTNIRDVARTFSDLFNPFSLLINLSKDNSL